MSLCYRWLRMRLHVSAHHWKACSGHSVSVTKTGGSVCKPPRAGMVVSAICKVWTCFLRFLQSLCDICSYLMNYTH